MCKKTVILHVLLVWKEIGLIDRVYIYNTICNMYHYLYRKCIKYVSKKAKSIIQKKENQMKENQINNKRETEWKCDLQCFLMHQ